MNNKQKEYILDNYNNYGLYNDHGEPITRADMLALLNILEVNGETLDSLHDVALCGGDEFCSIYNLSGYENDSAVYNALVAHHIFLSDNEFIDWILEQIQEDIGSGDDYAQHIYDMTNGESDTQIYKTNDGYVIRFDY